MVRQYIGARYTTKIYENSLDPSSAEWEANVNYEPLTMVTYNNGSYLSKKEVPANIGNPAANGTYWVQTGFYNGQIANLQNQIDNINVLLTPEMYGAIGDGVADDTAAINAALADGDIELKSGHVYRVSSEIKVTHSIFGNNAKIKALQPFTGIPGSSGVVPTNNILKVFGDDIIISDLTIEGATTTDRLLIGVYVGNPDIYTLISPETTTFNYSVHNLKMSNINIVGTDIALLLADVWNSTYDSITTKNCNIGVDVAGQSVNNFFNNCYMENNDTANNTCVVMIRFAQYQNNVNTLRPEGISFVNSYLGWSYRGITIDHGFTILIDNCILDQIANSVIYANDLSDVNVNNSYLYCHDCDNVIQVTGTIDNNYNIGVISSCTIITRNVTRLAHIGAYNRGLKFVGCHLPPIPCYADDVTNTLITFDDCAIYSTSIVNITDITGNCEYNGNIYNIRLKRKLIDPLTYNSSFGTFSGIAYKLDDYIYVDGTFTCTTSITTNWSTYIKFDIGHTALSGNISANDNFRVNIGDGSVTRYALLTAGDTVLMKFMFPLA